LIYLFIETISERKQRPIAGQLSLASFRVDKSSTNMPWLGLNSSAFTCIRCQVTLCDPIWQVTLIEFSVTSYTHL